MVIGHELMNMNDNFREPLPSIHIVIVRSTSYHIDSKWKLFRGINSNIIYLSCTIYVSQSLKEAF